MANIKSQQKRIITNEKSRQRNISVRSKMRTVVKQVREAIASKDQALIAPALKSAISVIDRAASKGVIHANSAARKKSELQNLSNAAQS